MLQREIRSTNEPLPQLFVGGLSSTTASADLFDYFQQFGLILYCEVQRSDSGKSKRFGFVKYADPAVTNLVFETKDHYIGNKKVTIEWAFDPIAKQISQETRIFRKVYVGNIPSWTNKPEIEDLISTFGKIEKVTRLRRKDDGSMYCYAIMQDIPSAQNLLSLQYIKSRGNLELVIKPFTPQKSKVDQNLLRFHQAQRRAGPSKNQLPQQAEFDRMALDGGEHQVQSYTPHYEVFGFGDLSRADKFPQSQKSEHHITRDEDLKIPKIRIRFGLQLELRQTPLIDTFNFPFSSKAGSNMNRKFERESPDSSTSDHLYRFNIFATKRAMNKMGSMV